MAEATKVAGQILFQNSLAEVVRKLRSTTKSESEVIEQCIADIKKEITSTVQSVKVTAMMKAAYFSMLGYSAAYGAFNIIEVMADKTFAYKRLGYMAAFMTFTPKTDVLPLLTALLKRDLGSANQYEVGFALYCIASVCTPDLARDLVADVVNLLSHPRNYVRKKAVLSLYRIFFEYPDSLRPTYPRLKEKLENNSERCDNDPAVRGAVVCVLCELARRNPENFLGLAVPFFSMLTTVHSNWTLIKIVKVFGYFAPLEPRLGKKLVEPIANLIRTTSAKSVQYECVLAVASGMSRVASLTKLAADQAKSFVEDSDQNLKYLGLDAMSRMLHDNLKLLSDQRDAILVCLDDADATIRRKALEILSGLVTKKNFVSTIDAMMERCVRTPPDEEWSNRVMRIVIETAQRDDYALVQDFEWYTGVLLHMSFLNLSTFEHGGLIERELVTVLTRVPAVRSFGVLALSELLSNPMLLKCDAKRSTQWEVLKAAAFLCGEYPYWLPDKRATCERLVHDRVALLHPEAQVPFVAAAGKIAAYVQKPCERHLALSNGEDEAALPQDPVTYMELRAVLLPPEENNSDPNATGEKEEEEEEEEEEVKEKEEGEGSPLFLTRTTNKNKNKNKKSDAGQWSSRQRCGTAKETEKGNEGARRPRGLHLFRHSVHPDVQEHAALVYHHIMSNAHVGPLLYTAELCPVAAGAQSAVEPPEGMDLDEPFCAGIPALLQFSDSDEEHEREDNDNYNNHLKDNDNDDGGDMHIGLGFGEFETRAANRRERARKEEVAAFYIKDKITTARADLPPRDVRPEHAAAVPMQLPAARKTQTINRDLLRPVNYNPDPQLAHGNHKRAQHYKHRGAGGGGGELEKEEEEDEATRKFRNVDLSRALAANERLPEAIPYAQLLQMRSGADKKDAGNECGDKESEAKGFEPVVALVARHMRVTLRVTRCHAGRGGLLLFFTAEIANLASSSSAYDVTLSLEAFGAADGAKGPRLVDPSAEEKKEHAHAKKKGSKESKKSKSATVDEGKEHYKKDDEAEGEAAAAAEEEMDTENKEKENEKNDVVELRVSDRIKGTASATCEAAVLFPNGSFPASLTEPLPLRLTYVRDKRPAAHALPLPLAFEYFAKAPRAMPAEEFNTFILAQRLAAAPLLTAFVPLDAANISRAMPRVLSRLRLRAVEIYRDAVSLHGTLHARKSAADDSHVAALLRVGNEKGEAGVCIAARAQQQPVAEALIQSIAAELMREGTAEEKRALGV